jgi:hypothetical protein
LVLTANPHQPLPPQQQHHHHHLLHHL